MSSTLQSLSHSSAGGSSSALPSTLPQPPSPQFPARVPPVSRAAKKLAHILSAADIEVNGTRPWDVQVFDSRFYRRVLFEGSLGAGESYMDGWWEVPALDEFFRRIHLLNPYDKVGKWITHLLALRGRLFNLQSKWLARKVAEEHYDLGNDIYEAMLGRHMQYTCGYWPQAHTLEEAQAHKLHLICRKLHLAPGMQVLDLGGGFGGLARFMAAEYGCQVVSYNISREQIAYGRKWCLGLPVRFEEKDYRDAANESGRFDRIAAIGLCEHIGQKNYRNFLKLTQELLQPGGLFLLHTIGSNESVTSTDAWMDKYVFPNGVVPSLAQLSKPMEGLWVVEDLHNFGPDYDRTLMAWWDDFHRAWPGLQLKYGDRFYRMWKFYLMGCAGRFRARKLQLWQLVLSKGDISGYQPSR